MDEPVVLKRDVEAAIVPVGDKVVLKQGEQAIITQSLGSSFTVIVGGNMFRIDGRNADALGIDPATPQVPAAAPETPEALEAAAWEAMRSCYDPEIPVNIVDLGLIYDCKIVSQPDKGHRVDIKMTLTAPGCGMGPMLAQDVQSRIMEIPGVDEANVELVWDPPWHQSMMTEAARLQLGLY